MLSQLPRCVYFSLSGLLNNNVCILPVTTASISHAIEFAKTRTMRASVVYVGSCQLLIFTCERAKCMPVIQFDMPTCQRRANISTWHGKVPRWVPIFQLRQPKGAPEFQVFSRKFFNFSIFQLCLTSAFQISKIFGQF